MKRLLSGLLSGLCATAPMTLVMVIVHRLLPGDEQYPLPPYEIAREMSEGAGAEQHADDEQEHVQLALISHFAFGAGAGGVYGLLGKAIPLSGAPGGIVYGLVVWGANYLGLLPATGLYHSPVREPLGRHAMMIAAHVVWGAVLGLLFQELVQDPKQPAAAGQQRPTMPATGERYSF